MSGSGMPRRREGMGSAEGPATLEHREMNRPVFHSSRTALPALAPAAPMATQPGIEPTGPGARTPAGHGAPSQRAAR
jgi:hypothetical protein